MKRRVNVDTSDYVCFNDYYIGCGEPEEEMLNNGNDVFIERSVLTSDSQGVYYSEKTAHCYSEKYKREIVIILNEMFGLDEDEISNEHLQELTIEKMEMCIDMAIDSPVRIAAILALG